MLIICFCPVLGLGWAGLGPLCCISHHLVLEHWDPSHVSSSWTNKPLSGHTENEVKVMWFCVCVNVFPKYRNQIYPEAAQQWSHGECRSLHIQFYMLSLLLRCGGVSQAAPGAFWPLGVWKAILRARCLSAPTQRWRELFREIPTWKLLWHFRSCF